MTFGSHSCPIPDFAGVSRQFVQQGSALAATFFLSLLVIYLVLAAQFASWRNPLVILVSIPMSIAGAKNWTRAPPWSGQAQSGCDGY